MPRTEIPLVTLRLPREADIEELAALRNDLATQYSLLAYPKPNSNGDVCRWIERRTSDANALFFVIADANDVAGGFAQIVGIDAVSRHGSFGIAIAERLRGRGYGRAGLRATIAAAEADGRLGKLVLYVAADHANARSLYGSEHFREVGVFRRHYRGPKRWHDVVAMERLLDRPEVP